MKRKTYSRILALTLIMLSSLSCVKENLEVNPAAPSGKEGFLTFDFGSTEDIQVVTKSSVDHKY